ncbi:hypothetical protein MLD38_027708 [Melastoma candidum]|uniref:Uncharacterized protein n=1 Tax=Melastoma candidum TaxID=119954 RepID=A0ACB9P5G9_9MYRT|nr:hypothetical protein MLD38_027708 [Melastoma candidum]
MDRNLDKVPLPANPVKNPEQFRYVNPDAWNQGLGSSSQAFFHDPSMHVNANIRPPDYIAVGSIPVHNFSIQTGEEFNLEFMRERVNLRPQIVPAPLRDPMAGSGYLELKGMLGISHAGSESGSDISRISLADKVVPGLEGTSSLANDERGHHDSVRSVPRASSRNNIMTVGSSLTGSSDGTTRKVKFLCSFGGKILPRPSDGKLRYVGGETRIIRISRDISWQELIEKTLTIYNQTHSIKYQLPGEDLDALVSVSCDEDLQNMMEECNVLEGRGTEKPRIFLFSSNDLEDVQLGLGSMDGDSEVQYVVAINGMDVGSRLNSIGLGSASGINLDQFIGVNADNDSRITGARTEPFIVDGPSSIVESSRSFPSNLAGTLNSHVHSYPRFSEEESGRTPSIAGHLMENFTNLEGRGIVSSSVPFFHTQGPQSTNFASHAENVTSVPFQGVATPLAGLNGEYPVAGQHKGDAEVPLKELKLKRDSSAKKILDPEKATQEREVKFEETKVKREDSRRKMDEIPSEIVGSSLIKDDLFTNQVTREEVMVVKPVTEQKVAFPRSASSKLQEVGQKPSNPEAVGEKKKIAEDDHFCASGAGTFPLNGGPEADPVDISSTEPPLIPQRAFYSERIPREQAEMNRLSKSNDSFGSQFLISQAISESMQSTTEVVDKLHDADVTSRVDAPVSFDKPVYRNSAIRDGVLDFQTSKESTVKSSEQLPQKTDSKIVGKDEIFHGADKLKDVKVGDKEASGLLHHSSTQGVTGKPLDDTPRQLSEYAVGEGASKKVVEKSTRSDAQQLVSPEPGNVATPSEPAAAASNAEHGDILIDINDRFPRDFLSDIFSVAKVSQNYPNMNPLPGDGAGLSLNMQNHDPKRWSYFRNLAQDEFLRKDISLMDQDHLGFSSPLLEIKEVTPIDYSYPPLIADGNNLGHVESRINYDESMQQVPSGAREPTTRKLEPESSTSHAQGAQGGIGGVYPIAPDSEDEERKSEAQNINTSFVNLSLNDVDFSSLQIIENDDLEELKELGSGTFGTVYHGKWRGTDVAIKRIKKSCFTGRSSEQERLTVEFWREADILSKLHHPNVVAFYGVVKDGPGGTLATVTEYMVNGSLRHVLLSKDRYLDRRKRIIIAMDAAFGMEYLHSKNIVHFDLKCDNLLVNLKDSARPICKVGDFGLSKIKRNTLVTGGVRGTLPWMAPELLNGSSNRVSEKVDVFSFGIVLWEILTGEEPYANMHYGAIIGGIVNNTLRPPVPSFCDPEWKLLMEQCWAPDPVARPSFTEIARRLRAMSTASQSRPPTNQVQR